ncbi:MAG TPA: TonB-dependent receptor plug domain-containing protein [Opitutaceae bacterium]|nr:TonB-dependent receptor plug domain-containing protein [Opitutaceae bacterium]
MTTPFAGVLAVARIAAAVSSALLPLSLLAQKTPTSTSDAKADEPVVLSPFDVIANSDGYTATTTQVATGFNRDVRRTPLAINVITDQFIREAGFTSYNDLADYIPNAYVENSPLDGNSTAFARGHGTSFYSMDGRRYYTDPVIAAGGRLEVIKGPATLFFGRAQPGGIFNFSTPPPSPTRLNQVTASYGTYDNQIVNLASQGSIVPGKNWLTYRLDAQWQNSEAFVDNSFADKKFGRVTLGVRPLRWVNFRLSYEETYSKATGTMRSPYVLNPQYVSDYKAPRAEQLAWAKAAGRAGVNATDAQAVTFLQNRWRESSANWATDTITIYNLTSTLPRFVGVDDRLTPYGWEYNDGLRGTLGRTELQEWGGTMNATPLDWLSLKATYYKYDLNRLRNLVTLNTPSGDGLFRATPSSTRNKNDSQTISAEAIANYPVFRTRNTTHIGASWYHDDFYQFTATSSAASIPLNSFPGDIRPTTSTIYTPGWNPFTQDYPDIRQYLAVTGDHIAVPTTSQFNRDRAVYGSHILELFDGKLGILTGGRMQKYRNDFTGFHVDADVYTLGASWEIVPELVVYASKSTSFEPSTQSFVEGAGTTVEERLADPAPPRTGRGWDIGAKYSLLDQKLLGTFTLFETIRVNDFRTVDSLRTDNDPRNLDAITTNNVTWYTYGGERYSKGVEAEITYQPNRQYVIVAMVSWMPVAKIVANPSLANLTLLNGTVIKNPQSANQVGQRSSGSPEYKASFWNRYRFDTGTLSGLSLGYGISYQEEVFVSTDPTIAVKAPSYTVSRAAIEYPFKIGRQNVNASLIISNLFDQRFYRGLMRAEPRVITLRLSTQF